MSLILPKRFLNSFGSHIKFTNVSVTSETVPKIKAYIIKANQLSVEEGISHIPNMIKIAEVKTFLTIRKTDVFSVPLTKCFAE